MDQLLAGRAETVRVAHREPAADGGRLCEQLGWRHAASTMPGNSSGRHVMLLKLETHTSPEQQPAAAANNAAADDAGFRRWHERSLGLGLHGRRGAVAV